MKLDFELKYGECFEVLKKYINLPVVIAGYGVNARLFMGIMAELNISILAVCDKNKVGEQFEYLVSGKIKSYEYLKEIKEEYQIIIASEEHYDSIKSEVLKYVNGENVLALDRVHEVRNLIPACYQLSEPFIYKRYL